MNKILTAGAALILCAGLLTACADSQVSIPEETTLTTELTTDTTTTAADPKETALEQANAMLKNGQYDELLAALNDGAMKEFAGDPQFAALNQQAEALVSADVKKTVQNYLDAGDSVSAYQEALKQAKAHPNCQSIRQLLNDLSGVQKESVIKMTEQNRDLYLEKLDYTGAERFISMQIETYPDIPELADLKKDMVTRYTALVKARAEALFLEKKIAEAVSVLDQAIASVGKSAELTSLRNVYGCYVPTYINTLRAADYNDTLPYSGRTLTPDDCRDATGKAHENMFYLGTEANPLAESYAEYNINGLYTEFHGVYGSTYADRGTGMAACFRIFGDGRLLYASPPVSPLTTPKEFYVDLTGVQKLRIVYPLGMYAKNSCAAIFDCYLRKRLPDDPALTTEPIRSTTNGYTTTRTTTVTTATYAWNSSASTSRTWWSRPQAVPAVTAFGITQTTEPDYFSE